MFASVRTEDRSVLRPVYAAAALVGLAVPLVSLGLVGLTFFQIWPVPEFSMFILFMYAAAGTNLVNLLLSLRALKAGVGPYWFRDSIGIAAVFSGMCLAVVVVLLGMFAALGG